MDMNSTCIDFESVFQNNLSVFLSGKSGIGKTTTIINFLKQNEYDYTLTTIQELESSGLIDLFTSTNIMRLLTMKRGQSQSCTKKKIIVVDNIDYIQTYDKKVLGEFASLLKNIEFKTKYKRTHCILFVGNDKCEKKDKTLSQRIDIHITLTKEIMEKINNEKGHTKVTLPINQISVIEDTINDLCNGTYIIGENLSSDNDKQLLSLCFHENVEHKVKLTDSEYSEFIKNICDGDYYDRICFQKQLWYLNELCFMLKVLKNYEVVIKVNTLSNTNMENVEECNNQPESSYRFTKVLTKYSNEYSNFMFLKGCCNILNTTREELFSLTSNLLNETDFSSLDANKHTKKDKDFFSKTLSFTNLQKFQKLKKSDIKRLCRLFFHDNTVNKI